MGMGGNENDFMGMGGMGTVKVIPAHLYCTLFTVQRFCDHGLNTMET